MSGPYDDIIDLPYNGSTIRPKMSMEDRAVQFHPIEGIFTNKEVMNLHDLLPEDGDIFLSKYGDYYYYYYYEEPALPRYTQLIEINAISDALMGYLAKKPTGLYLLEPRDFEKIVARLYEKLGYHVKLTPAKRDGGKDIILHSEGPTGSSMYLVECKKYAYKKPVDVNIVREFVGVMHSHEPRPTGGIIVTTSRFTNGAIGLPNTSQNQYTLALKDFERLSSLLKLAFLKE